jgi:hypothetical protein
VERFAERLDSILAVKPLAPHPSALAVGPEEQVKLVVAMHSSLSLMVLVAQFDSTTFSVRD